jgi:formate dehydrogenase assembly factor FdhD
MVFPNSSTTDRRKLKQRIVCGSCGIDALKRLAFEVQELSRQTKSQQQAEI